jgi:intracellular multiplication protein IcmB
MGDALISQSTGRFVLRAGDEREAEEIIDRFNLSDAECRGRAPWPARAGPGGAPFLAILEVDGDRYEQKLVNSLGPIELWALSTTPGDTALRNRLYARLGFSEGLARLARIFPSGSALKQIERRKADRLRGGEQGDRAETGVIEELADELSDGKGIGLKLLDRGADEELAQAAE